MKRNVIFITIALLMLLPIAQAKAQIAGQISTDKDNITLSERDGYDVIRTSGANALTRDVGAPELPAVQKSFVIPQDASVVGIDITTSQRTELTPKSLESKTIPYYCRADWLSPLSAALW